MILTLVVATAHAWDPAKMQELDRKSQAAKAALLEKDPGMKRFFDAAAGYVIIPTVGKGGVGIGVAVFTYAKGGLMYEATVGGQKFKVSDKLLCCEG